MGKNMIFKGKDINSILKNIIKNKKLSENERFVNLITALGAYYFLEKHYDVVNMEVFELYYERFMGPEGKDEGKYRELFSSVSNRMNFVRMAELVKYTKKLKNIDVEKLTDNQKSIYQDICTYKDKYFNKKFNCGLYYIDNDVRKMINSDNKIVLDKIIAEFKTKVNKEEDLFSVNTVEDFNMNY